MASGTLKPGETADAKQETTTPETPAEPEPQPEKAAQPERPMRRPCRCRCEHAVRSLHARWAAEEAAMRRSQPEFSCKRS